jgi:carbonic anhydrase/acetyltransferase-like protein (isoleucine patch superfamily)
MCLADAVHIGPGAVLANVSVGERTFVGANALIKRVVVGKDVVMEQSTVVITNIPGKKKVVETPENDLNMNKVIIIAEAGVNHNGDIQVAKVN